MGAKWFMKSHPKLQIDHLQIFYRWHSKKSFAQIVSLDLNQVVQQSRTRRLQSAAPLDWEVHGSNLDPAKSFQIFSAIKFCAHFC